MVIPSKSVVNPLTQKLYVPSNGPTPARIVIYQRTADSWTDTNNPINLPSTTAKCFGLAVSQDGGKLFISISNGNSSKLRIYNLDANGLPIGSSVDVTLNTLASRASRAIDRFTKVENSYWYETASATRYFTGSGRT